METADFETATGRRFLVTHGDDYDTVVVHAKWLAHLGDRAYVTILWLNTWINRARWIWGGQYWSLSKWAKHQVKKAVSFISAYETVLADEARRGGYDGVICGHIHHANMAMIGDVEYVNTGDWVESCTALVERTDGQFEILRWGVATGEAAGDVVPLVRPEHATADVAGEGLAEAVDVPDRRTA